MSYCATKPAGLQVIVRRPQPELPQEPPLTLRIRGKAEAYEYRIYELEMAYMMQLAGTPESKAAWGLCERVKANYHRAYPGRPLHPKPRPSDSPAAHVATWMGPPRKERKTPRPKPVPVAAGKTKRGRPPGSRNQPKQAA